MSFESRAQVVLSHFNECRAGLSTPAGPLSTTAEQTSELLLVSM